MTRLAGFPVVKTLDNFNYDFAKGVKRSQIEGTAADRMLALATAHTQGNLKAVMHRAIRFYRLLIIDEIGNSLRSVGHFPRRTAVQPR